MKRGVFISFEGGEGVGKSTQIKLLAQKLAPFANDIVVSREPGGTPGAEAVRHTILTAGMGEPFGPAMEAMLFAAARNDHIEQLIRPAVARGAIVLIDRFLDSTRVYQGVSGALEPSFIGSLERVALAGMVPDLTILLDLDPDAGMARAAARRVSGETADRFEKEDSGMHIARRKAFLTLAKAEPNRIKIIDAAGKPGDVAERVFEAVKPIIPAANDEAVAGAI